MPNKVIISGDTFERPLAKWPNHSASFILAALMDSFTILLEQLPYNSHLIWRASNLGQLNMWKRCGARIRDDLSKMKENTLM